MTVHRWFSRKECPGDYLYDLHGKIAAEVNQKLSEEDDDMTQERFNEHMNQYLIDLAKQPISWEQEACLWAQENKLLNGDQTGNLMPKKFCTRGEIATILKSFYHLLNK